MTLSYTVYSQIKFNFFFQFHLGAVIQNLSMLLECTTEINF